MYSFPEPVNRQQSHLRHHLISRNAAINHYITGPGRLFNGEEVIFYHNDSIQVSFDRDLI